MPDTPLGESDTPEAGAQHQAVLDFAVSRSSAVFYIADLAGDRPIRFISSNVRSITGHEPDAFLRDSGLGRRLIHPDDLPAYMSGLTVLQQRGEFAHEYRFATASGEYRWFHDDQRLIDDAGNAGQFVGCMFDITARVSAEAENRRLSRLLRGALESIPNGFALYDADDRLVLCNTACAAAFDAPPEALIGSSINDNARRMLRLVDLFNGQKVSDPEAIVERVLARIGMAEREPVEIRLKSGRWMQITSHPIADGGHVHIRTDITSLKDAEASLRESEEQFRSIVEANPSPVRVADLDTGEILYESPATAALLRRPWPSKKGWLVGENYADAQAYEDAIGTLKRSRRIDNRKIEMRHADGTTFWVALSSRTVRYQGKDVCVTSFVDLTETLRREAELQQSRETLDDAIEALNEGVAIYDAEDRLVMCNRRFREEHGPAADLLVPGATWLDMTRSRAETGLFPDAVGRTEAWIKERARRRTEASEDEIALSNGRWVQVSHRRTHQGGIVHVWRDVTERRRMVQELRESEAQIRHILKACPVPITLNRAEDGVILYESPAARALLRYAELEPGMSVVPRWVNPDERRTYLDRLRRDGAVDGLEIRYRKTDGEEFWTALSSRLIEYRGEEVIVSNLLDLTERHAAQAELERQRDMLHQSEKLSALGELLAGVAHELNNPLSVLVGQALMLRETAPDERTAERAEKIGKAADRCARIVKTFLAMARHEPTEMELVDLNAVIESALEVTAYLLRTSGVDVSLRLARDLPTVTANADQMRQVLTNLIVNAQNALQDKDGQRRLRITSRHHQKHDQIVLKVKDNGPGIPTEIRSRIFEPLFTTKDVGAGTGMGLALCHRIVEAHGGTITVEQTGDDGAVFTVRIPRAKKDTQPVSAQWREETHRTGHRILVVDDEYDVGEIISDVLEHDGHIVEVAHSGTVALQKIRRGHYDVILSDIRMPGMDGPGLYRALSATKPEQIDGLAFITGDTLTAKVREFLETSERPYLEKPILPRDIRELISLLMRRKTG